jgi:putative chitinase
MGNGNIESGEGFKFRGRGLKQLTGKDNHRQCSEGLGVDLVANPDMLLEPQYASLSAAWFWSKNKCGPLADSGDFVALTKRINGGTIGLEDRQKRYKAVLSAMNVS